MPAVLTIGEPIVAIVPSTPDRIDERSTLRFSVGGAELNTAVALRRLGVDVTYIGRVGDDILGRLVLDHLRAEGIDIATVTVDPTRPTACYVREWLPDGQRRISYHRSGAAGSALGPLDVRWSDGPVDLVHVTGITMALSPSARQAVEAVVAQARSLDVGVSFDPNHRPLLWSAEQARQPLLDVADRSSILLLSEDDRDVMYPGSSDDFVVAGTADGSPSIRVLKLGARGAIAMAGGERFAQPVDEAHAVDPVGAGDAFDAGFIAAHLAGAPTGDALRVAAHVAARVVEAVGDHEGAPRLDALPPHLAGALRAAG